MSKIDNNPGDNGDINLHSQSKQDKLKKIESFLVIQNSTQGIINLKVSINAPENNCTINVKNFDTNIVKHNATPGRFISTNTDDSISLQCGDQEKVLFDREGVEQNSEKITIQTLEQIRFDRIKKELEQECYPNYIESTYEATESRINERRNNSNLSEEERKKLVERDAKNNIYTFEKIGILGAVVADQFKNNDIIQYDEYTGKTVGKKSSKHHVYTLQGQILSRVQKSENRTLTRTVSYKDKRPHIVRDLDEQDNYNDSRRVEYYYNDTSEKPVRVKYNDDYYLLSEGERQKDSLGKEISLLHGYNYAMKNQLSQEMVDNTETAEDRGILEESNSGVCKSVLEVGEKNNF